MMWTLASCEMQIRAINLDSDTICMFKFRNAMAFIQFKVIVPLAGFSVLHAFILIQVVKWLIDRVNHF